MTVNVSAWYLSAKIVAVCAVTVYNGTKLTRSDKSRSYKLKFIAKFIIESFYIEKEANTYGIMNTLEYIKKYFPNIQLLKKEIQKDLNSEIGIKLKNNKGYLMLYKLCLILIKISKMLKDILVLLC